MREELDSIVKKYNLIERTFESFWCAYDCYLEEEPEECKKLRFYDRGSAYVELYGYAFFVTDELVGDCIKVYLDIFQKGEDVRCGDYWCVYGLDGEEVDWHFLIH